MIRQARTGDTVLDKSREMTGRTQTLPWLPISGGDWGERGKDDRKQNTLDLRTWCSTPSYRLPIFSPPEK
jgi:hypothetical protein